MKVTAAKDECPKCKSSEMVMGMSTGNIKVYGCLKCRNMQGHHLKMRDAKEAWKKYKAAFNDLT
jgi:hypothetical protein